MSGVETIWPGASLAAGGAQWSDATGTALVRPDGGITEIGNVPGFRFARGVDRIIHACDSLTGFSTASDGTGAVTSVVAGSDYGFLGQSGFRSVLGTGGTYTHFDLDTGSASFYVDDIIYIFLNVSSSQAGAVYIYLSQGGGYSTNYAMASISGTKLAKPGWNVIAVHRGEFSVTGTVDWRSPFRQWRVRLTGSVPYPEIRIGGLATGLGATPIVMFDFDDAYTEQYTIVYPEMVSRAWRWNIGVNGAYIGDGSHCTQAQLLEMYNATVGGADLINHAYQHLDLTILTAAQVLAQVQDGYNYIIGIGAPRGARHFIYPYNKAWIDPISPPGPPDTTVRDTVMGSGVVDTARGGTAYAKCSYQYSAEERSLLRSKNLGTFTLAEVIAEVDAAIKYGQSLTFYCHKIIPTGGHTLGGTPPVDGNEWYYNDFVALLDAVKARERARACIAGISRSEYYKILLDA